MLPASPRPGKPQALLCHHQCAAKVMSVDYFLPCMYRCMFLGLVRTTLCTLAWPRPGGSCRYNEQGVFITPGHAPASCSLQAGRAWLEEKSTCGTYPRFRFPGRITCREQVPASPAKLKASKIKIEIPGSKPSWEKTSRQVIAKTKTALAGKARAGKPRARQAPSRQGLPGEDVQANDQKPEGRRLGSGKILAGKASRPARCHRPQHSAAAPAQRQPVV